MRVDWLWDRDIPLAKIKAILADEEHERFSEIAALLLARNNVPREVFNKYLAKEIFVRQWAKIKLRMRRDQWSQPRIVFWQAVYERVVSDMKARGELPELRRKMSSRDELCRRTGERIRILRQESQMTQGQLAQKMGISQQIISRIEKGQSNVSLLSLKRIAHGLGKEVIVDLR